MKTACDFEMRHHDSTACAAAEARGRGYCVRCANVIFWLRLVTTARVISHLRPFFAVVTCAVVTRDLRAVLIHCQASKQGVARISSQSRRRWYLAPVYPGSQIRSIRSEIHTHTRLLIKKRD